MSTTSTIEQLEATRDKLAAMIREHELSGVPDERYDFLCQMLDATKEEIEEHMFFLPPDLKDSNVNKCSEYMPEIPF